MGLVRYLPEGNNNYIRRLCPSNMGCALVALDSDKYKIQGRQKEACVHPIHVLSRIFSVHALTHLTCPSACVCVCVCAVFSFHRKNAKRQTTVIINLIKNCSPNKLVVLVAS